MMKSILIVVFSLVTMTAVATDIEKLREKANNIFAPIPKDPPEIEDNPSNPAKVELGTKLFFDPRLSRSGTISCASCHNLGRGGADNIPTSIGHGWQTGPRNAPTVLNSVFNIAMFWDGRAPDLKSQAKQPIQAAVEMNNAPERVVATMKSIPEYVDLFQRAFPGEKSPVTFDNVARAIEVFEATLITPNAPFDRFMRGDDNAMTERELRGLDGFITHGCVACHRRVNVGGNAFFPFGMRNAPDEPVRPANDEGRAQITGKQLLHRFHFRVAPLRNVALTAPYFHSGQVWDLEEAIRIMAKSQLDATLSDEDVKDIVVFLHTLTGEQPDITIPILPPSTSDTPRPEY
jgi:cytochrome c peroxidase